MFLERRRASLRIPETGVETSTGVGLTMLLGLEHRLEKRNELLLRKDWDLAKGNAVKRMRALR
jgi:hypothetical protein